jgi:hypothetical protein
MKWRNLLIPVVAVLAFAPQPAQSQSLVGMYYRCSTADEGEADFIMNQVLSRVFDRNVEAGNMTGWGWVEHQAGGAWRRIATITAPDRSALMTAWGQVINEIEDEHPNAWHRFNEICDSHDDYIWSLVASDAGSDPSVTPDAWVSTYWVCSERTEARANEIFQETIAPVIDRHIAAGHLGGYGWYAHDLGGRFRRLMTLQAADDFDLLEGRQMVIDELQSDHADALDEFSSICNGHVDYLWANARSGADE